MSAPRIISGQMSIFPDEEAQEIVESVERSFDLERLRITEWNSEGYVTATDACAAISYGEVFHFREFIKRLDKSEKWGVLSYRTIDVRTKHGARHFVDEPLLTEKQLAIVYMRCDLPNMAEVRSLIADVFVAWKNGKLKPTDAKTETDLLHATERAIDAAPEAMSVLLKIQDGITNVVARLDSLGRYLFEMQRSFDENVRQPRLDETAEVRWQQDFVVAEYLDCRCPICRKNKILKITERSVEGRVSSIERDGNYQHAHLLVRTMRGLFFTMPMCRDCNQIWERKLRHKEWVVERVRSFHRLLREVWGILDIEGEQ